MPLFYQSVENIFTLSIWFCIHSWFSDLINLLLDLDNENITHSIIEFVNRNKLLVGKSKEMINDLIDEVLSILHFENKKKGQTGNDLLHFHEINSSLILIGSFLLVFRYGDYGDKFYIILEGTVSVNIPMKVTKDNYDESSHSSSNCM